jgi:hypothetical protein
VPLPELTAGGLLPVGVHRCTLAEVHEMFVQKRSARDEREALWQEFVPHLNQIESYLPVDRYWVDGSFVTDCESRRGRPPADIDLVVLVPGRSLNALAPTEQARVEALFTRQGEGRKCVKPRPGVDAYPVPVVAEGDQRYHTYAALRADWLRRWSEEPDRTRKGFLEILSGVPR